MPASGLTLQNRITTLMIILTVILISSFTIIQLNNQTHSLNRYNSYRASLSALVVKNNIEAAINSAQGQDMQKSLGDSLTELKTANLIKEAVIFDHEGNILASTDKKLVNTVAGFRDAAKIYELESQKKENTFFIPEISRINKNLELFVGIKAAQDSRIDFVAKLSFPLANIQEVVLSIYKPVSFTILVIILINILIGYLLSRIVIGPIKTLNQVTKIIAEGDLSVRTNIQTNDELQELGTTFNYMAEQLIKMKERAENANPLTKLPGNVVIHEEIEKKIGNDQKFTVIYCDLDNFKAFNDKYGIGKGDEAIKLTAQIFKEAIKTQGNPEDFVGHEGGDDFILVTSPDKAKVITDYIIDQFDKRVRDLYTQEDLRQGYIVAHARDNTIKQFPIMTISLAGVTNQTRKISSYGEVTNIAAEVKKKAKALQKSNFVLDLRNA